MNTTWHPITVSLSNEIIKDRNSTVNNLVEAEDFSANQLVCMCKKWSLGVEYQWSQVRTREMSTQCILNKLHHRKVVGWANTYRPPTNRPSIAHLQCTNHPPTDHLPTDYQPATYQPLTDHLPTTYQLNTYRPPTDHLPTDHQPTTYRPLFMVQLVQYFLSVVYMYLGSHWAHSYGCCIKMNLSQSSTLKPWYNKDTNELSTVKNIFTAWVFSLLLSLYSILLASSRSDECCSVPPMWLAVIHVQALVTAYIEVLNTSRTV